MLDYANRFHHDTNLAWEVQAINDQELLSNCTRVLAFAQRARRRSLRLVASTLRSLFEGFQRGDSGVVFRSQISTVISTQAHCRMIISLYMNILR